MTRRTATRRRRRALTLVELMLATCITGMVALAICGMVGAVSAGVDSQRDTRRTMLTANAAQARIASYVAPARCFVRANASELVVWLADSRAGGTIHASELRWLRYEPEHERIAVHFVKFPGAWTDTAAALEDKELLLSSNWSLVLQTYETRGLTASLPLVEGVSAARFSVDDRFATLSRHARLDMDVEHTGGPVTVTSTGSIRLHRLPSS